MDIKTAFLNEYFEEDIYMEQSLVSHPVIVIIRSTSCKDPYMDSSKHLEVGTLALMM